MIQQEPGFVVLQEECRLFVALSIQLAKVSPAMVNEASSPSIRVATPIPASVIQSETDSVPLNAMT